MRHIEFPFGELRGVLDLPHGGGRYPVIVCLHPSSDGSAEHFLFLHLAQAVVPLGVGVLRFNRRGFDVSLDQQAIDAVAAIDALKSRPDIDGSLIGVWGFSQGAWVGPIVAARSDAVAFLILIASTGVSPAAQMRYGTAFHLREAGYDEVAVARMLEARDVVDRYRRGAIERRVAQDVIDRVAGEPWFPQAWISAKLPGRAEFWPSHDFEPEPVFAQVRVPTLLFYGEADEWTPVQESVEAWKRAAASSGNNDVTVIRLAGTRHHPTYGGITEASAITHEYTLTLVEWVQRITGSKTKERNTRRNS